MRLSPDGGRIAYRATNSVGNSIYRVVNADGGSDHPLASPGAGDARYASWSPDGSRVVYEGALLSDIQARKLYVANSDGSGTAQPLTTDGKSRDTAWCVVSSTPPPPPPHPGAEKPKVVWITKRIPWIRGRPLFVARYFCGAPGCSVQAGKVSESHRIHVDLNPRHADYDARCRSGPLRLGSRNGRPTLPSKGVHGCRG